jgi:hypothetical protein
MQNKIFNYFGFFKKSEIIDSLNFARCVAKRLDEHREIVEAIINNTNLFKDSWHVNHMATQDDYLMRLYYLVHGQWPENDKCCANGYVRNRPDILGLCRLPEYNHDGSL